MYRFQIVSMVKITRGFIVNKSSFDVVHWWLLIEPKGSKWKPHVNIQAQQECSVPKQHNLHWYVELGRMLQ